jgi:cell division protein FtsL
MVVVVMMIIIMVITASYLKTEVQRETRKMKDSIVEKTKDGMGRGCMDKCHIA